MKEDIKANMSVLLSSQQNAEMIPLLSPEEEEKMNNKKKAFLLVAMIALVVPLVGCIEEPVAQKWYLMELEVSDQQISNLLGVNTTEVAEYREKLNIEIYVLDPTYALTTADMTAEEIYEDFCLDYVDWVPHYDDALYDFWVNEGVFL